MLKTYLVNASVATMLATGALAQTSAPAPQAPAAPAQSRTAVPPSTGTMTRAASEQLTTSKIVGISVYAPKPDTAATTGSTTTRGPTAGSTASPAPGSGSGAMTPGSTAGTTGSTAPGTTASGAMGSGQMTITPVSDEQWRTMRDQHDSIGTISDLLVGADGRISHAVLGVGGFLGIGEKNVALPLGQLRLMRQADGTLVGFVSSTKQQLKDMPTFDASRS
ncbi:PRC-barrel domain-containing protein [Phreatobacter sp.]|uniref:PRC-barrel domain-containing protein n=1 Tax=Phreatobacter sp. TaxID=1966341 RepID=UPI0025D588C4|nr:PRC-barrel domain-containing protein [Phreatobacter sp.]